MDSGADSRRPVGVFQILHGVLEKNAESGLSRAEEVL